MMERNAALDILKLLMAFMVVGLHAGFLGEYTSLGQFLTVQGLFRIAVPVFLIINGFYFYHALNKGKEYAWLKKVLVLYLVWMLIYSYFWFWIPGTSKELIKLGIAIIIGYQHLWYISGMIGAALILLLMYRLSFVLLVASIVVSFIIGAAIQYLGNYHYFEGNWLDKLFNISWVHRNALFFSYPFFAIGFLINKYSIANKISNNASLLLTFIGTALLLLESYINYIYKLDYDGFDNYFSLLIVCPFIFLFFIKSEIHGKGKNIALYSSGVYFIHSLVLSVFRGFSNLEPTALTAVTILVSLFISYFIILLHKRVRFIL